MWLAKASAERRARVAFALVVLLGSAAGLGWYWVDSSRYTTFEIRTHDVVSGLNTDSPVEFHGVEVGKVKRVQLIDPRSVRILLSVRRKAPITRATIATITTRGLAVRGFTGYVCIALEDIGSDSRPLRPPPGSAFALIPTAPPQSLTLDTTIGEVKHDVQVLTALLQSVFDQKTVGSLKQSLENLQTLSRTLTVNSGKLEATITNAERASDNAARASTAALRASRRFKPLLQSSQDTIRALQTEVLPEAYDTLDSLHKLSSSLQAFSLEVQQNPSILIRGKGKPPPGPGERH